MQRHPVVARRDQAALEAVLDLGGLVDPLLEQVELVGQADGRQGAAVALGRVFERRRQRALLQRALLQRGRELAGDLAGALDQLRSDGDAHAPTRRGEPDRALFDLVAVGAQAEHLGGDLDALGLVGAFGQLGRLAALVVHRPHPAVPERLDQIQPRDDPLVRRREHQRAGDLGALEILGLRPVAALFVHAAVYLPTVLGEGVRRPFAVQVLEQSEARAVGPFVEEAGGEEISDLHRLVPPRASLRLALGLE